MKKIFSILLSLALVVGLSLATAAPVMAVTLPSISPTTGEYDMDNPGHVATTITWGDATSLTQIEDDVDALTAGSEYYKFESLVVITEAYLDSVLDCIGDEVVLHFEFDLGDCFLTVTAVGTPPALEDNEAEWNFWGTDDVVVGIDWGIASDIADVKKGLTSLGGGDWAHNATTLTIMGDTGEYLDTELTSIGDTVELTVIFDSCDYPGSIAHTATLTIEAVGVTAPRVAPTSATYDLCLQPNHPDMTFTITWDGASAITSVKNVNILTLPIPLSSPSQYSVAGNTLTLSDDNYLDNALNSTANYLYLQITFNDAATTKVNILISAAWSNQPFMGVTSNIYTYDLDTHLGNLGASGVGSLANFGCATTVTAVKDNLGYTLTGLGANQCKCYGPYSGSYDYITMYIVGYGYLVIITPYYLPCNLTSLTGVNSTRTMTVSFDKGADTTFIINAVGIQPSISPTSAEFNLDAPANVTTTVTLGPHASSFTIDGLTDGVDYTVSGDTVTVLDSYLSSVLEEIDDVIVLKFKFDEGVDATLNIKAIGTPLCFIATAAGADAPELDILREFRDVVLRPNSLGAKLISLYYEASPPIAELISQNEALKTVVKACLIDPIAAILSWSQCLWS